MPPAVLTRTATVGRPRESSTSVARTVEIRNTVVNDLAFLAGLGPSPLTRARFSEWFAAPPRRRNAE